MEYYRSRLSLLYQFVLVAAVISGYYSKKVESEQSKIAGGECPLNGEIKCDGSSKYRSINGTCNNLKNLFWGSTNTTYARLVTSKYSDGVHAPPVSLTGEPLPSARNISIRLYPENAIPDPVWTLISMSWGQVMTHDLSFAAGYNADCCGEAAQNGNICLPITLAPDDPFYAQFNQSCLNFARTLSNLDNGCNSGRAPVNQLAAVTHWLDASLVYGSDEETEDLLRERVDGKLKTQLKHKKPYPPSAPAQNRNSLCPAIKEKEPCYQFGDSRGDQNTPLTVSQTLLLREHNRLASALKKINPHWDDEKLFQEARRILIAEYQHISYYEWLPIFLGEDKMLERKLIYKSNKHVNDYNDRVDPSVLNGYATAAFRYFHSAIQGFIELIAERGKISDTIRLSDYFNRPVIIEEHAENLDDLVRGLTTQSEEKLDAFHTREITNYLFRAGKPFGSDLKATDIQRGRDHGLGSYNDFREYCKFKRAEKFDDFLDFIDSKEVKILSDLFAHPNDVDFTVGGSIERHASGALVGPTFSCVILEQFYRTRVSDRYFYELGEQAGSFTPEQLNEIRKSSIARIFCDNGNNVQSMQPEGFRKKSEKNEPVSCNDFTKIPALNLNLWKEEHS